jgi:hypothetical protein
MRGLPYGFHYCGCDFCCPEVEFEEAGGTGEAQKLERVKLSPKPLPKDKPKCGEEMKRCYCEIFYRKQGSHQWNWAYPDASGNIYRKGKRGSEDNHSDDEYGYKAFCVYLALDDEADSTYWVCPCPCPAAKITPVEGDAVNVEISCAADDRTCGKCSGTCKLFRIEKNKHTAKWSFVDTGTVTVKKKVLEEYYYKCLCVRE